MEGKWVKLEQKGSVPGARSSHAVAVVGKKAYVFGGEFTPRVPVDNKLHVFDLHHRVWSTPKVAGDIPPPRVGVTMTAIGDIIYVFGGRDADHKELNELFSFDTRTNEWLLLSSAAETGPPHRSYHSMAADDRRIYIFGGCGNGGRRLNDLWAYDTADCEWIELPSAGEKCRPRGGAGLAVSTGKVWVVYGFSGSELDDVHAFDLASKEWSVVDTAGDEKPSARSVFSTVSIGGKYVFIYGGEIDPSDLGHLGAGKFDGEVYGLDTETCGWIKVSATGGGGENPGQRGWCAFSAAEIDGEKGLFVYGGNSSTNDRLDDIFFFVPCL